MAETPPPPGGFGIYVHWPFCAAKCPYCDFNSHVRAAVDQQRWADALARELTNAAGRFDRFPVQSIFFGGGTPSLMAPKTVEIVLDTIAKHWPIETDVEITLEANPTSVEAERFATYAGLGINRVSMGIQALNDADLRSLGRLHTMAEAMTAFEIARTHFERVSFDLIYARQGQSVAAWTVELEQALAMAIDHLSLYQLTIEPGTAFGTLYKAGRLRDMPDQDLAADLYEITQEICAAAGMPGYEISNHSQPGAESRHNLVYWRGGSYLGVGPGAHGRVWRDGQRIATETLLVPEAWLEAVETTGTGMTIEAPVGAADQAIEYLMMGLRLREGVDQSRLAAAGLSPQKVDALCYNGFLSRQTGWLVATPKGRLVLNAVLRQLLS